jgi:hypothetical protein
MFLDWFEEMTKENQRQLLRKPLAPKLRKIELDLVFKQETPPNTVFNELDNDYSDASTVVSSLPSPLFNKKDGRSASVTSDYTQDYAINKAQTTNTMPSITFQDSVQILNKPNELNPSPKPVNRTYFKMKNYKKYGFGCISSASTDPDREPNYNYNLKSFANSATSVKKTQNIKISMDPHEIQRLMMIKQYSLGSFPVVQGFKPLGPDPLPKRYLKHLDDKTNAYNNLTYNEEYQHGENGFTLNDLLLYPENEQEYYEASSSKKPIVSNHNYKQICKMLEEKVRREQNNNCDKVCVQMQA